MTVDLDVSDDKDRWPHTSPVSPCPSPPKTPPETTQTLLLTALQKQQETLGEFLFPCIHPYEYSAFRKSLQQRNSVEIFLTSFVFQFSYFIQF